MSKLSDAQLREIKARGERATKGPWNLTITSAGEDDTDGRWAIERLNKRDWDSAVGGLDGLDRAVIIPWDYEGYSAGMYIRDTDANFIVHARTDIPALLSHIDALEAENAAEHRRCVSLALEQIVLERRIAEFESELAELMAETEAEK